MSATTMRSWADLDRLIANGAFTDAQAAMLQAVRGVLDQGLLRARRLHELLLVCTEAERAALRLVFPELVDAWHSHKAGELVRIEPPLGGIPC